MSIKLFFKKIDCTGAKKALYPRKTLLILECACNSPGDLLRCKFGCVGPGWSGRLGISAKLPVPHLEEQGLDVVWQLADLGSLSSICVTAELLTSGEVNSGWGLASPQVWEQLYITMTSVDQEFAPGITRITRSRESIPGRKACVLQSDLTVSRVPGSDGGATLKRNPGKW